jgi:hypothetical protein
VIGAVINTVSLDLSERVERQKLRGQNTALSDISLFRDCCMVFKYSIEAGMLCRIAVSFYC